MGSCTPKHNCVPIGSQKLEYNILMVLRLKYFMRNFTTPWRLMPWASYQIRKIAGYASAGNAGNVFPATDFKGKLKLATAVMDAGITNPRWREKRSRHSRRMRNMLFYISGKRPMDPCAAISSATIILAVRDELVIICTVGKFQLPLSYQFQKS